MIVFDMDWTLTPSRDEIEADMAIALKSLLKKYKVWIISGWDFSQFQIQILQFLWWDQNLLKNLYICPTCSTKMYIYKENIWHNLYSLDLSIKEKKHIISVLETAIIDLWLTPPKIYWELIEDRWTQISYAFLWQIAPRELKSLYDPDFEKRKIIRQHIIKDLKWFDVLIWWSSTIDITRTWVDKAYGIEKLIEITWFNKNEIIFVWDAIFPWGNDYPPLDKLWITTKKVFNLKDTLNFINELIK